MMLPQYTNCRQSLGGLIVGLSARLEQEPDPPLGLINEIFKNARGGYVAILVTNFMASAHGLDELLVVGHQFPQHVARGHEAFVVVLRALQLGNLPIDRSVVPPILRTRSAMSSVESKIGSPCSSSSRW